MQKSHVLLAAGLYPPDIGGPATFAVMLESELPKYAVEVSVLPFGTVRRLPKVVRHVMYTYQLWRNARHATHIFALDGISVGLPALIVSRLRQLPLIVRLGGDYAWEQGRTRFGVTASLDEFNAKHERLSVRCLAFFQRLVCRSAKRVIVPSQYLKSVVERWSLNPERVMVIHSVFHPPVAPTEKVVVTERPYIVSAGRLVQWKGFPVLIEVIARLRTQFPNITLDIFGDGEEKEMLEKIINKNNAGDYVRLRGKVDAATLHAAIAEADIFVLNTGYEGLSHQLLEALALKVPIVTTDIGGNRELLTHEVNGLLYPFNDSVALEKEVARLLNDVSLQERLSTAGLERVSSFSTENAALTYATIFKSSL